MKNIILLSALGLGLASSPLIAGTQATPTQGSGNGVRSATAEELEILSHLSVERIAHGTDPSHPGFLTLRVTGLDVQIVNGLGATNGDPAAPGATTGTTNSLGNLMIGYGEVSAGSHNVRVAASQATTFGSLAAGQDNYAQAPYSAAIGGQGSVANALGSVISGGAGHETLGENAVITAGHNNWVGGENAAVIGGREGLAFAHRSVIAGGLRNTVVVGATDAAVSGGQDGEAAAPAAAVAGGYSASINARAGFVGGGNQSVVGSLGNIGAVLGGYQNLVNNDWGTVIGGQTNLVVGDYGVVIGGVDNRAGGRHCVVSGGNENVAGDCNGGLFGDICVVANSVQGGRRNEVLWIFGLEAEGYQSISGGQDRTMVGVCGLAIAGEKPVWKAGGMYRCAQLP